MALGSMLWYLIPVKIVFVPGVRYTTFDFNSLCFVVSIEVSLNNPPYYGLTR